MLTVLHLFDYVTVNYIKVNEPFKDGRIQLPQLVLLSPDVHLFQMPYTASISCSGS